MRFSALFLGCQITATLAAPAPNPGSLIVETKRSGFAQRVREASAPNLLRAVAANANQPAAAAANGTASQVAANGGENAEGEENENNVNGAFDQAIQLGGNDVKTDVLFTKSVSF